MSYFSPHLRVLGDKAEGPYREGEFAPLNEDFVDVVSSEDGVGEVWGEGGVLVPFDGFGVVVVANESAKVHHNYNPLPYPEDRC